MTDARFELFNELRQWMPAHTANQLIDDYAHELAEQQRAERDRQYGPLEFRAEKIAINRVIDLIDPEETA